MNNKKRIIIYGISLLTFFAIILGTTFAFFNYTRTGGANSLATGQVKFDTTGTLLIDVSNDFPYESGLTQEAMNTMKNSHKGTLTITGHTTLTDGVKYRIYAVRGDAITGKLRLNDENINIQLTPNFVSGSNGFTVKTNDYAEANHLVCDNEGKALLSTGIVKGTSQLTSVTYDYYMWIDGDNTLISSTTKRATLAEGNPSLADTTSGNTTADRYMKNSDVLTQNVTIFPARSGDANKTVYTTNEFSNGYYNIKIVVEAEDRVRRDTEVVKVLKKDLDTDTTINFANASSSSNGEGLYILPGTEDDDYPIYYYRGAVTDNNVIFGGFCWQIVRTTETGGTKMIYNGLATGNGETCENTTHADRIISSGAFNSQYQSVADVGYMKNVRYTYSSGVTTGAIYGKNVEWDGTNYLVIEDTANVASSNTTKDNYHHYSCGTGGTTSCQSVRYYYYNNNYITLTSGEMVDDAIYKMTGNGDATVRVRNANYVLNNTDSTIKTIIESWFITNLTNIVDNTKTDYRVYLEDTVYCNDRSFKATAGNTSISTYRESGWNPNGGDLTKYLYFGTWNRFRNNWYSTMNVPSTACPNEIDRFSVGSSVAHLNYPVGLLTADEIIMAGAAGNSSTTNETYYLYTGAYYWSLSLGGFYYGDSAYGFGISGNGVLSGEYIVYNSRGIRPVISLNSTVEFETGGDGTPTNPYVVKYE